MRSETGLVHWIIRCRKCCRCSTGFVVCLCNCSGHVINTDDSDFFPVGDCWSYGNNLSAKEVYKWDSNK